MNTFMATAYAPPTYHIYIEGKQAIFNNRREFVSGDKEITAEIVAPIIDASKEYSVAIAREAHNHHAIYGRGPENAPIEAARNNFYVVLEAATLR